MHGPLPLRIPGIHEEVVEWRRHIHRRPEMRFEEVETSRFVEGLLEEFGLDSVEVVAKTGVVGVLRGPHPGPTLALRADMDALPIQEQTGLPFASEKPGIMHACGHDGHTAMLLGAAKILARHRDRLHGTVKFLFQPAEEYPGGGAKALMEAGVLEEPRVEAVVALHLWPELPTGQVGIAPGPAMAATDYFFIDIQGKGGHAAAPHLSADAIVAGSQLVTQLQQIVSRRVDPLSPAVVTVGQFNGGYYHNVIADHVRLSGTVRTTHPDTRTAIRGWVEDILEGNARATGTTYCLDYRPGSPPVINHPGLTSRVQQAVAQLQHLEVLPDYPPSMAGDDFAHFAQAVPACYVKVGCRNEEKGCVYPLHHPAFRLDEDALLHGVDIFVAVALAWGKEVGQDAGKGP